MSQDREEGPATDRPAEPGAWGSAVLEGMHDGAIAIDAHRRIAFVNAAVEESLGIDRAELVGAPLQHLVALGLTDPTGLDRIRSATERVLEADAPIATCEVTLALAGAERTLEIAWTPVEGPVTGAVGIVRDVTHRVAIGRELRERERALREERDRLSALFENVPDPVVAYEFQGGEPIVRDVNGAFEETFGFDREAVRGRNVDEYVVPDGAESEAERLNATLQGGERLRTTARRRTAEGERDFLLNVVPIESGRDGAEGFAIYTDVSEQKERERELERRNERLEEFASIVSHDLRNPLNVAQGFFELAVEGGDPDHVDRVRRAHCRMEAMIEELLSLARHGDLVGETAPVDLEAVATAAWESVDTPAATLSVPETRRLEADEDRLVELLENCYRNAVEHAGEAVAVTVTATAAGFAVADDGPGVPPAERERIFDSGYTTSSSGTGYGMTIVRQVAEGHGWDVTVGESAAGGARFHFRVEG